MNNKLKLNILIHTLFFLLFTQSYGKDIIKNYEPKNWWIGMNYNNILISATGTNLDESSISINYPGVKFNKIVSTKDPNTVFIDIEIRKSALPGNVPIKIYLSGKLQQTIYLELTHKEKNYAPNNLTSSDVIYQVVVDRFSNGQTNNDNVNSYFEKPNYNSPSGRHGGDLAGLINKIDYIKSVGATAIEVSPLYESNQVSRSYYQDAITNHFKLDKRLGAFSDIKKLIYECKSQNIKYIQTLVLHQTSFNHNLFGKKLFNQWIFDPSKKSFNKESNYFQSDPYADKSKLENKFYKINQFAQLINQESLISSKYLIQNTIWWIEKCKPDGIKIENTEYNTISFLSKLIQFLSSEYPDLQIITDINTNQSDRLAHISKQLQNKNSILNYDYPLFHSLENAFSEFVKAEEGISFLYQTMGDDFNYDIPKNQIVFLDNNNSSRFFNLAEKDFDTAKMLFTFMATSRGIPSFMYGSEILLEGSIRRGPGYVRADFPASLDLNSPDNSLNFKQKQFASFATSMLKWRSQNSVIHSGKTMHFIPTAGVYGMLRYNNNKNVLILYNNTRNLQKVNILDCSSYFKDFSNGKNPLTNASYDDLNNIIIEPKAAIIVDLQ